MFSISVGIPGIEGEASKSSWRRLSQPPLRCPAGSAVSQAKEKKPQRRIWSGIEGHYSEDLPPQAPVVHWAYQQHWVQRDITRLAPGCGDTRGLGGAGWHPDQEVGSCSCQADWPATQQAKTWKRWETLIQDPSRSRVWFTEKHVLMWIHVSKQRLSS